MIIKIENIYGDRWLFSAYDDASHHYIKVYAIKDADVGAYSVILGEGKSYPSKNRGLVAKFSTHEGQHSKSEIVTFLVDALG